MKKICFILCLVLILQGGTVFSVYNDTASYLANLDCDEWTLIGLVRGNFGNTKETEDKYCTDLKARLTKNNGILTERKYTEYSKAVLALSAIGKSPASFEGFNLVQKLEDRKAVDLQGINGSIWALIALDGANIDSTSKAHYAATVAAAQNVDGGWAIFGENSDPDTTAMALTALSKRKNEYSAEIEKGLAFLKSAIDQNGMYTYSGTQSSESCAQVIIALCSLEISPFTFSAEGGKSVFEGLEAFAAGDGGFRHVLSSDNSNLMATQQALCAYAAASRFKQGKTALYDMSDVEIEMFSDISGTLGCEKIKALANAGIVSGKGEGLFCPADTITRAEFATIAVNALKIPTTRGNVFSDVTENDWFFGTVYGAYNAGIVSGISESQFDPNGKITREQAAAMLARAAKTSGGLDNDKKQNTPVFSDAADISDWAVNDVEFCGKYGILAVTESEFNPREAISRAEMAVMIYNMLSVA